MLCQARAQLFFSTSNSASFTARFSRKEGGATASQCDCFPYYFFLWWLTLEWGVPTAEGIGAATSEAATTSTVSFSRWTQKWHHETTWCNDVTANVMMSVSKANSWTMGMYTTTYAMLKSWVEGAFNEIYKLPSVALTPFNLGQNMPLVIFHT